MNTNASERWSSTDSPACRPGRTDPLWTLRKGRARIEAALTDRGQWGWEFRFVVEGAFCAGHRFALKTQAQQYGDAVRRDFRNDGWYDEVN